MGYILITFSEVAHFQKMQDVLDTIMKTRIVFLITDFKLSPIILESPFLFILITTFTIQFSKFFSLSFEYLKSFTQNIESLED